MYANRSAICLAALAFLFGCERDPTGPPPGIANVSTAAVHDTYVLDIPGPFGPWFASCANDGAGEDVLLEGTIRLTGRSVYTPSGRYVEHWSYSWPGDFTALGLQSGQLWTGIRIQGQGSVLVKIENGWMNHETASLRFERQDGAKLHIQWALNLVFDKDGNLKHFTDTGVCPGQG
jgi:hypothetical protein